VTLDPTGKFAYAPDNNANFVSEFTVDATTGVLIPSAPGAVGTGMESTTGTATTGTQPWRARVDPSGKFLYVGDESSNAVSIFSINSNGTLTGAGSTPTGGPAFDISVISPK